MGISIFSGPNADVTASALAILAQKAAQELSAETNWLGIRRLIHNGLGPKSFPIGTQIADEWRQTAESEPLTAIWDVVNHSEAGMELNWHYAIPDVMPFDAPEAIYYAPAGGLAAGQYYITVSMNYGNGWVAGHHINFTLTSAMAAGDQLYINCGTNANNNPTAGRTWNVYARGSTTSKESGTTSDSDTGTELGATHTTKASLPNGNINAPQRVVYGYNRWAQSNIRQYLNATGAGGTWWSAQNPWDRPSIQAATVRGWLGGCSTDFINNIVTSEVVTDLNTDDAEAESKTTDTTYDKIYLPCLENWYINPQLAGEGAEWDYYKELAAEAGLPGKLQSGGTYPILIKYNLATPTSSVAVWLRSCTRGGANNPWYVALTGAISNNYASNGFTGCPACKILKES